jgi:hypothetical protein
MAEEIALNSAQVEAIRRGYTILESVNGYYLTLDNGIQYKPDPYTRDVTVLDHEDFWTIEQAPLETTSEDGTAVTIFYDDEDDWDFHEVSMDEFEDEPTIINDYYFLGSVGEETDGRKGLSHPSAMKEGLAATWSNHGLIVGIEDVVVGYGSKETTSTLMMAEGYGDYMGPLSDDGAGDLRGDCDGNTIDVDDYTTEEHLFEAWKQIDDESAKASISEALYILGYNIEATGHELVPFADE